MNQISWRHHYIPQFYLNGFTSKDKKFKIFDVQKNRFIKNGKDFSSESYFFEVDGNTIINDRDKTDFLEDHYADLDNSIAEVFNRINIYFHINKNIIDDYDYALLEFFAGIMYWRIPANFNEVKSIINRKKLKDIGLVLKSHINEEVDFTEIESKLKCDNNFFKAMKLWFPLISFPEIFTCRAPRNIITFPKGLPSVCGDNPIIFKDISTFRVYSDDFIFPLNNLDVFIRGEKKLHIPSLVKMEIDMLIYKQAKNYVSCTEERYLEELEKVFTNSYKDINSLRHVIFERILNS